MQTTIVPEQVKTHEIQAGVQVSRLEDKDVIFSIGSALEDFILFVLYLMGTFTDDELTEKELKQVEADDQAIQTILLGLPEDIYAAVDSCDTA
ncbi:hypothetical protein Tco_0017615 [Tanacetum coccineum]